MSTRDLTEAQLRAALAKHGISDIPSDRMYLTGRGVRSVAETRRAKLARAISEKEAREREEAGRATDFTRGARVVQVAVMDTRWRRDVIVMCARENGRYSAIDATGRRVPVRADSEARAYSPREHGKWTGPTDVLDALARERSLAVEALAKIDAEIADERTFLLALAEGGVRLGGLK